MFDKGIKQGSDCKIKGLFRLNSFDTTNVREAKLRINNTKVITSPDLTANNLCCHLQDSHLKPTKHCFITNCDSESDIP